ncbi:MAG: putative bile acid beta-glucosidase [Chthonomonadaceae bacterium]|nr:putative bile acid beta-glucosidase [Chthonomonadaceae bacterium]
MAPGGRVRAQAPATAVDAVTGVVHSQRLRSGLPLGGIGVGHYHSMTDGTIAPLANEEGAAAPDSPACFGAIWTRAQGKSSARVLALRSSYGLPVMAALDYDGLYPQARMRFPGSPMPLDLSLTTFSPLVPFDLKSSSLPAAAFVFHLHNPSAVPIDAAVALSWGEAASASGQVAANPAENGFFSLRLSGSSSTPARAPRSLRGEETPEITLMAYPPRRDAVVTRAAWSSMETRPGWWDSFASDGQVADFAGGTTTPGSQSAAVIIVHLTLKPGAKIDVPFAVAWTTPHRYAPSGEDLGHYYQVAFADSYAVARYLLDNGSALYGLTEEWQKRLLASNLPVWMSRRLINSAAALSTSALHTRDGRFVWNGEPGAPDLPLTSPPPEPIDQREARLGAFALALDFFPVLAAQEVRHAGSMIALHTGPPTQEQATDYLLRLAQYTLGTNDRAFLQREYPHMRRALAALLPPETGSGGGADPSSAAAWSLRLAALEAGRALARLDSVQAFNAAAADGLTGDIAAALPRMEADRRLEQACAAALRSDTAQFVSRRWTGHYFADAPDRACATDQLFGSWIANAIGVAQPFSQQHITDALTTLRTHNDALTAFPLGPVWRTDAQGQAVSEEGADCLVPATVLSEAILSIQQNQPDAGVSLLQRLEATRDNALLEVWNTPLRFRADSGMISSRSAGPTQAADWNLLSALEGFAYDPTQDRMTLSPRIPGTWRTLVAPVFSPTFWGHVEFKPLAHGALVTFRLDRFIAPPALKPDRKSGLTRLTLRSLRVPGLPQGAAGPPVVHASLGPNPLGVRTVADSSGDLIVMFATPLSLSAGDRLEVDIH